jgi:TolB protein
MKHRILCALALASAAALGLQGQQPPAASPPQQQEVVVIMSGSGGPPKIAIAPFVALSQDAETVAAAKTIGDVLYDDIAYEREYYMIGKDAIATAGRPASLDNVNLAPWKELNADGLIVGSVRKEASGVVVQVKLIQVASGRMAFGKEYSGSVANPRRYAHTIADEIHKQQFGLTGVARSRITFSSDRDADRMKGSVASRDVQEIYYVDYDGFNTQKVTNTKTLNITPAWSPDNRTIAYTSYRPSGPSGSFGTFQDIILSFIYTGERKTPADGSPQRQNYLPAWSPDGSKIAYTSNGDGNPEIYIMNADGSGRRRMTNHPSIDVNPTWSPTGNQIAWVSERTGTPKIYIMNVDGTGQRTLVNEECYRPTWSGEPFNEIAYAAKTGPGFDIKIYSFSTGESRKITDGIGTNESPVFSPNGRHIAFTSTRTGKVQVFTVARDGNNLRQITREGNNKFPNWSR